MSKNKAERESPGGAGAAPASAARSGGRPAPAAANASHSRPLAGGDSRGADLDPLDRAIIQALQIDGRTPYSRLGPAVGLSQAAVRQRVQRLVERGVIQVVAVTDPAVLGLGIQAMIGVVATGDLNAAAEAVSAWDEAEYVVVTTGRFDLLVEVVCADMEHLMEFVNDRVRATPGVTHAEVFSYLRLVKQTYSWGAR